MAWFWGMAVFPRCSLLTYRFRYACRYCQSGSDRLGKQPTDPAAAGRKTCYFGDRTLDATLTNMQNQRKAGLPFILVTVFLDTLGFGFVIPILPALVATMTPDKQSQAHWYGLLLGSYGLAQFFSAPLLGAISDRYGRRTVLLVSIFGIGLNFFITAISPWLWLLLISRLIGGASGASFTVAGAYVADVTSKEERSRSFGLLGAVFGLGFICGPILGGMLTVYGLRLPYFVAAGFALLNWIYGFSVLPESLPTDRRSPIDFAKANPFTALIELAKVQGIGSLVLVFILTSFPQFILQSTWILYASFRFGWGPRENGFSLFVVGIASALGQAVLLRFLLNRLGDVKTALLGLASSSVAYVLYGLATKGWMMYAIILANLCGFAAGPALQGIISRSVDPRHQGITLGSMQSIGSIMGVIAPLIGAPILAAVSGLNPDDWRVGATFFVAAISQWLALIQAFLHFRRRGLIRDEAPS
jgi:DHA1 family tetracycline resistance protein-like MFS transporter